jgi:hypothetical protein
LSIKVISLTKEETYQKEMHDLENTDSKLEKAAKEQYMKEIQNLKDQLKKEEESKVRSFKMQLKNSSFNMVRI